MTETILVRGARQLVTVRGAAGPRRGAGLRELGILADGALLIRDGIIVDLGQGRRVENLAEARKAREVDATGCVVMPGLVDCCAHLCSPPPGPFPGEHAAASPGSGPHTTNPPSGVQHVRNTPSRTLLSESRRYAAVFARHGTTTLEAKSGYGLDSGTETKILRVFGRLATGPIGVVPCYFGARAIAPEYQDHPHEYINWAIAEMLPLVARRRLARFAAVTCGRGGFCPEDAHRFLSAAREAGLGLKVRAEHAPRHGAVRLAAELGATASEHAHGMESDEVAVIARSNAVPVLLPGRAFHSGHGDYPPARKLVDHGAAVALATGFDPVVCPVMNMAVVLSLAVLQMRLSAAEAIAAATINAAHAMGCAAVAGSLETGKQADLAIFEVPDYREIPHYTGANLVRATIKKGVTIYQRGAVLCRED